MKGSSSGMNATNQHDSAKRGRYMRSTTKRVKWVSRAAILFVIMSALFTGQPVIVMNGSYANDQGLDPELTNATVGSKTPLTFSSSPLVQPPNPGKEGDLPYAGGHVIEGVANVYLIYWSDPSFQKFTPKYMSLIRQFVIDVGHSPLESMLSQYTDSNGLHPTGVKLAGVFLETTPFPQALVDDLNQSNFSPKVMDQTWRQEIKNVAAKRGWDTSNYHNVFAILPNTRRPDACGYHKVLAAGSPYLFVAFSSINGKVNQGCNHAKARVFPNNDPIADVAVSTFSHELSEVITDPQIDGWGSGGSNDEIGDKCNQAPYGINQKTKGDVTWVGHTYLIQREYDNKNQGCTLRP
jgi:hypothetical protein